jgi:hypothetical protein
LFDPKPQRTQKNRNELKKTQKTSVSVLKSPKMQKTPSLGKLGVFWLQLAAA